MINLDHRFVFLSDRLLQAIPNALDRRDAQRAVHLVAARDHRPFLSEEQVRPAHRRLPRKSIAHGERLAQWNSHLPPPRTPAAVARLIRTAYCSVHAARSAAHRWAARRNARSKHRTPAERTAAATATRRVSPRPPPYPPIPASPSLDPQPARPQF